MALESEASSLPSLSRRLRWVFGAMECSIAIFLFTLIIAGFRQDLQSREIGAYEEQIQALQTIEEWAQKETASVLKDLNKPLHVETLEQLQEHQKQADAMADQLMRKWLSPAEYERVRQGHLLPVMGVMSYSQTTDSFQSMGSALRTVLASNAEIPGLSAEARQELELLRKQGVTPKIDAKQQTVTLSAREWQKLDPLDGILDGKAWFPHLEQELNSALFEFNYDSFERNLSPMHHDPEAIEAFERPGIWVLCYVNRMSTRFGIAHHKQAEFAMNLFGASPLQTRDQVVYAKTRRSRQAFQWNFFPPDYGEVVQKEQGRVHLFAGRVLVSWLNENRLQRSLVPQALAQLPEHLRVRIVYDDSMQTVHQPGAERLHIPADKGSRARLGTGLSSWWVSSHKSGWLDSATVFMGTPAFSEYRAALIGLLIQLLLFFGVVGLARKRKQRLLEFLEAGISYTLRFILASSEDRKISLHSLVRRKDAQELQELRNSMTEFISAARMMEHNLEFDLRLQRILAEPDQNLEWYLEEFWYAAHATNEALAFQYELNPSQSLPSHWPILVENQFVADIHLPSAAKDDHALRILQNRLSEIGERIELQKRYKRSVQNSAELELGMRMQNSLQRAEGELECREYRISFASRPGREAGGDFAVSNGTAEGFMAGVGTVFGRGVGSSLQAQSISVFIEQIWNPQDSPENFMALLGTELAALIGESSYLSLCLVGLRANHNALWILNAGHWPAWIPPGEPYFAGSSPMGVLPQLPGWDTLKLKAQQEVVLLSGAWFEHSGARDAKSCLQALQVLTPFEMGPEDGPLRSHAQVRIQMRESK